MLDTAVPGVYICARFLAWRDNTATAAQQHVWGYDTTTVCSSYDASSPGIRFGYVPFDTDTRPLGVCVPDNSTHLMVHPG